jgi:hypothetical protein
VGTTGLTLTTAPLDCYQFSISSRIKDEGADHRPTNEKRKVLRVEELATHEDLLVNAKSKL